MTDSWGCQYDRGPRLEILDKSYTPPVILDDAPTLLGRLLIRAWIVSEWLRARDSRVEARLGAFVSRLVLRCEMPQSWIIPASEFDRDEHRGHGGEVDRGPGGIYWIVTATPDSEPRSEQNTAE